MTGEIYDYPTRILVHSESEKDASYLVDLCAYDVTRFTARPALYNGACQCKDFLYRCLPRLRAMAMGDEPKIHRCKHIRWARENCLDFILPKMAEMDPNPPEDHP